MEEEDPELKEAIEDCKDVLQLMREEIEMQDTDVFSVEDVCDVGEGKPLFANFAYEDWAMLSLRAEMNMLIQSFLHDCADPDRSGIHPEFIPFYFGKYFRRNFSPKFYGVNTMEELVALIDDTLILHGRCVETQISTEIDTNEVFVALTEDARRIRWRCGHSDHPLNPKPINPKP
ncbi:unnamed protein product [Symbiodinium sp. KB8]|nr:unnamed protein product [Symbiodinium sp. KB8]